MRCISKHKRGFQLIQRWGAKKKSPPSSARIPWAVEQSSISLYIDLMRNSRVKKWHFCNKKNETQEYFRLIVMEILIDF